MNAKLYKAFSVLFLMCPGCCFSQAPVLPPSPTQTKNYVVTNTPQNEGVTDVSQIAGKSVIEVSQVIQYIDDLGRPVQSVNVMSSPVYNDVISAQEYDAFGREVRGYLPFSTGGTPGAFKTNALKDVNGGYTGSAQYLFYQNTDKIAHDQVPFGESVFENSPLGRVLKQGAPGTAWKAEPIGTDDHAVEYVYRTNGVNEVLRFDYNSVDGRMEFNELTYYAANQLFVKRTIDEHNFEVFEYTDKQGRIICKKVQDEVLGNSIKHYTETYYIYDDLGNLTVVLPPEAVVALKSALSN